MKESIIEVKNLRNAWNAVRTKESAGGIDGTSVEEYGRNIGRNLEKLHCALAEGRWTPKPYVDLRIPKPDGGERTIGLSVVEDKIVQTAIKTMIEPLLERTFSSSSYAYRPGRGHQRCVRRVMAELSSDRNGWFFRGDIDNFFDSIDRELLFKRLRPLIRDGRVVDMIDLCMSMGRIDRQGRWSETGSGLPQGAVLSPILANFYLNSFDQSMSSRTTSYVRYSDDFVIFGSTEQEIRSIAEAAVLYLREKMHLSLNDPYEIGQSDTGFSFLGLHFRRGEVGVTDAKLNELSALVENVKTDDGQLSRTYIKSIEGIQRYYLSVLPSSCREIFRTMMDDVCERWKRTDKDISQKTMNQIRNLILGEDKGPITASTGRTHSVSKAEAIRSRKLEYRRMEAENAELVISGPGYFIGSNGLGLVLRKNGQPIRIRSYAVRHITIIGSGIGISSNLVSFCRDRGISIDFFSSDGKYLMALLSPSYMSMRLWAMQSQLSQASRVDAARRIILFKVKNQRSLCRSMNKYHGNRGCDIAFSIFLEKIDGIIDMIKSVSLDDSYASTLMAYEAQAAAEYWEYLRNILENSGVEFYSRVKQGAKDVVNSMLNYGYSLLYPRLWQAVLRHGLNPYSGLIHYAEGNPNLVFDLIELFRCQAVDRVVISMINKGERCAVDKEGKLLDETRSVLTRRILDRMNRYEKYRGESRTLSDIIDLQVADFARYIKDGSTFRPYIAKW